MTESWTINTFIIGCILLLIIPIVVYLYKEIIEGKRGDSSGV